MPLPLIIGLQSYEIWIIAIGALVCASCGLLGCFLLLRRLSLMGDAISHAVLPGIVLAVICTGQLTSIYVVIGAGLFGLLTCVFTDWLKSSRLIHEDTSIGAVFTMLFALGIILVTNAGNVDLDADCVLYGEIAISPFNTWLVSVGGQQLNLGPKAFWILATVFVVNVIFVGLFYKELKILSFDQALAQAMGLRPQLIHYLLMTMVAVTTISAFDSVGAIIVVAMFIAPGACAYLLTDRLSLMLFLAVVIGACASLCGYFSALALGGKVSIAGCMAMMAGVFFIATLLLSPKYGIISRLVRRRQLQRHLLRDNIIMTLYRCHERQIATVATADLFDQYIPASATSRAMLHQVIANGWVQREGEQLRLSASGQQYAGELMRAHRLWEVYMHKLGLPPDHVHRPAAEINHFLSPELCTQIAQELNHPQTDPHGKPIPGKSKDEN